MKSEGCVWAFDLGRGSLGEAVRKGNDFLHKQSLLIPGDFADTKPATNRRRMWRTRIAHHQREKWLEDVWRLAGLPVLYGRNRDKQTGEPKPGEPADPRLEREFAPATDSTCFTSCLLRIRLLRSDSQLADWQIFKALRSAIQRRGYGRIPWAEKEARRSGKNIEDLDREELAKDPNYLAALSKWRDFKNAVPPEFHFPCFYDAWKMGLWTPDRPNQLGSRLTHAAQSTRNVRFDRDDVAREIHLLANNSARLLPALSEVFARIQNEGWHQVDPHIGRKKHFPVRAKSFGDFLCYGPSGSAYASFNPAIRADLGLHLGSTDDWMGALGQKIPRFDNRILEHCTLIPRLHVCKAEIRRDEKSGLPFPDSLLHAEVTFLMKLKNTLVSDGTGQRKLTPEELRKIFHLVSDDVRRVKPTLKNWTKSVADRFSLSKDDWANTKGIRELQLRPLPGHEAIKPPKYTGRSAFSRPALRLLKELLLSGTPPHHFHAQQTIHLTGNTDPAKGLVPADLKFLLHMGTSWADLHIPAQRLDSLVARHMEDGRLEAANAITELLGTITDPVVRHRLGVFADRCQELHRQFGIPDQVVLEFVREDFMGPIRWNC